MKTFIRCTLSVLCILFALPGYAGLGTSAAVDKEGNVWIAYSKALQADSNVEVMRFNAERNAWSEPLTVTARPEPVSDDGENRPKLAFGPKGEMYVTWTSPTSAKYTGDIRFARSLDGGKTWSVPHTIGVWGLPSFLLRLRDGRLLMSYGHRRAPLGNQARISSDWPLASCR